MKFLLPFFILFLLPFYSYACSCAFGNYSAIDRYLTSEFVGVVEIENVKDLQDQRTFKAFLNPVEIMKGTMPEYLLVQGSSSGDINSAACEISIRENEKWLFYLNKNQIGEFQVNLCSFPIKMTQSADSLRTVQEPDQIVLDHFRMLAKYAPEMHLDYVIKEKSGAVSNFMRQYSGTDLERGLYLYQIEWNAEMEVQHVDPLLGLSPKFDRELETYLKENSEWEIQYRLRSEGLNQAETVTYIISIELK